MNMIYGYCRVSTKKQDIERQVRNIVATYPSAIIVKETYTGTKIDRPQFNKILKNVKKGDTIVFDSVSRMSRSVEDGIRLYEELYDKGVTLVFLKEPHINTTTYDSAKGNQIELVGDDVDLILKGVNQYLLRLARKQIELAFSQSQKEVEDLRQRTREGIESARLNGKQIGQKNEAKLNVKKKEPKKQEIKKLSKDFDGNLNDKEVIQYTKLARNTYYKYKKELMEELS